MSKQKVPTKTSSFEDLGLSSWLCQLCHHVGMQTPTPIQQECIPRILQGEKAVLACAPTGTGKTAAYALPILQSLSENLFGIFSIVLSPTRELAMQIADQFHLFGRTIGVRIGLMIGGLKLKLQFKAIEERAHILIGTPGRIRYILLDSSFSNVAVRYVKYIVLDEADKLLAHEKQDRDSQELISFLVKNRSKSELHYLLFSATLKHFEIATQLGLITFSKSLLETFTNDNETCVQNSVKKKSSFVKPITEKNFLPIICHGKQNYLIERFMLVPSHVKLVHLACLLAPPSCIWKKAMVFVNSKRRCELVRLTLQLLGLSVIAMHGLQSQKQRMDALTLFKIGGSRVMICTDVFARGLDISGVEVIIHYDLPGSSARYIHRSGRTARAGMQGLSLCFVTERDVGVFRILEAKLRRKFTKTSPTPEKRVLSFMDTVAHALLESKMIVHRTYPPTSSTNTFEGEAGHHL